MRNIYQRIVDPKRGDCYKCTICALLDLGYDDIPNLVEYDDWLQRAADIFAEHGYKYTGKALWNPNVMYLENPTDNVWEDKKAYEPLTLNAIKPEMGINGLFMASVYSPNYTNPNEHPINHLHSVLCDINFNIVFDPNFEYEKVVNYPYSKLIGYNGIRMVDIIEKI